MKILQVCKKFPYPPKDGEMIAIFNFSQSFVSLGHQLTVASLNTNKHYYNTHLIPAELQAQIQFITCDINTDISISQATKSILLNKAYNIQRFYSPSFESQLIQLLQHQQFDLILLEGLPVLLYLEAIRKNTNTHITYRAHNVEYEIWERLAINTSHPLKKLYYKILAKQVKAFEKLNLTKVDSVISISKRDESILQALSNFTTSYVAPACIDEKTIKIDTTKTSYKSIFFLGALDWIPNLEGIQWFIDKIFPSVLSSCPETNLYIGGRNIPTSFYENKHQNIHILGEIKEVNELMNAHQIMIVPLLTGSGMRIKIIEAMFYGKCIVSTTIGAEGIDDENSIYRCDNESIFATEIIQLLNNSSLQMQKGEKAKRIAQNKYSALQVSSQLLSYFQKIIPAN
ncbi:MAG: glycosyltransferase [Bacteroidota bacterium]